VRFQQIQKYECGANRISAARLWRLSEALEVPVGYFYDGLVDLPCREPAGERGETGEVMTRAETQDLIRAYYQLEEKPRRRLLDLAKSLNGDAETA
jgi:transcriptional regulator with XRE-family HTH domain